MRQKILSIKEEMESEAADKKAIAMTLVGLLIISALICFFTLFIITAVQTSSTKSNSTELCVPEPEREDKCLKEGTAIQK